MEENSLSHNSGNDGSNRIFTICDLSLNSTTILLTIAQICLTLSTSLFMYTYLPHTIVNSILIFLSVFCCGIAIIFLLIRIWERIFGSTYNSFFHEYLLSMLLMALISFFEMMYFPLSLLQTFTDWNSPTITYYSILIILSAITLFLQFLLRTLVEEMFSHVNCNLK
ncbi:putative integral membrane protein [Acanthocheilonema viteae]